jgi:hypothetical protein
MADDPARQFYIHALILELLPSNTKDLSNKNDILNKKKKRKAIRNRKRDESDVAQGQHCTQSSVPPAKTRLPTVEAIHAKQHSNTRLILPPLPIFADIAVL